MGRRVPESNRTARLCRPLPNRSVNAPPESVLCESFIQAYGRCWRLRTAVRVCRTLTGFFGLTKRVCDAPIRTPAAGVSAHRDYELSSLAALERGDGDAARMFTCLAIALFETAEALDEDAS